MMQSTLHDSRERFYVGQFKIKHTQEQRERDANVVLTAHHDRIPVIVEYDPADKELFKNLDKQKYLVPLDLTVGQFMYVIRKRIKLPPETAIYMFFRDNTLATGSTLMSSMYSGHKDPEDQFLYIRLAAENTFGAGGE
jgi:GABA(A) receptor-associated protein